MRFLYIFFLVTTYLSASISWNLYISKENLYLGEPVIARAVLEFDKSDRVDSIDFKWKRGKNFEVKKLKESKKIEEGDRYKKEYIYLLTPLKTGELHIPKQSITLSYQDRKNYRYISHKYDTKVKTLRVKRVPDSLEVVGDYNLTLKSDANFAKAYHPIHIELKIEGVGNIDYIKPFKLNIADADVYPSKPKIEFKSVDGGYRAVFIQRWTVISPKDIKIPSIKWRYFNINTEIPETLYTKEIDINIDNPKIKEEFLKRLYIAIIGFIAGVLLTIAILLIYKRVRFYKFLFGRNRYRELLPYANDKKIKEILEEMESKRYKKRI